MGSGGWDITGSASGESQRAAREPASGEPSNRRGLFGTAVFVFGRAEQIGDANASDNIPKAGHRTSFKHSFKLIQHRSFYNAEARNDERCLDICKECDSVSNSKQRRRIDQHIIRIGRQSRKDCTQFRRSKKFGRVEND